MRLLRGAAKALTKICFNNGAQFQIMSLINKNGLGESTKAIFING